MSVTIVGCLIQADGMAQRQELSADLSEMRWRSWSSDAHDLRQHHETPIVVNIEHRPELEIGEVVGLYRNVNGDVYATAVCPGGDRLAGCLQPLYFSGEFEKRVRDDGDIRIAGVGITGAPATVSAKEIQILKGSLEERGAWVHQVLSGIHREAVDHACEVHRLRYRQRGAALEIGGHQLAAGRKLAHLHPTEQWALLEEIGQPAPAALRLR